MHFDYMIKTVAGDSIDILDIGNCALQINNDRGEFWYLIIKTELGWTEVFEFGPITPDIKRLPTLCSMIYKRFEYRQNKIEDIIFNAINSASRNVTQVTEVSVDDAKSNMRNLVDYV